MSKPIKPPHGDVPGAAKGPPRGSARAVLGYRPTAQHSSASFGQRAPEARGRVALANTLTSIVLPTEAPSLHSAEASGQPSIELIAHAWALRLQERFNRIPEIATGNPYSSDVVELVLGPPRAEGRLGDYDLAPTQPAKMPFASILRVATASCLLFLGFSEGLEEDSFFSADLKFFRSAMEKMSDKDRQEVFAALLQNLAKLQERAELRSLTAAKLARVVALVAQAVDVAAEESEIDPTPPLFENREPDPKTNKLPTALEWFDLHWRARVEAGEVTGDDLKRLDPRYYSTFAATLSKRGQKISDFLPPSPTRGRKDETEEERAARLRAGGRERMRRWRAGKAAPK